MPIVAHWQGNHWFEELCMALISKNKPKIKTAATTKPKPRKSIKWLTGDALQPGSVYSVIEIRITEKIMEISYQHSKKVPEKMFNL